jgi:hypothetical protein
MANAGTATETAVIVAVDAAEPAVAEHRRRFDVAASWGVPAHVTVLYPFVDPSAIDDVVIGRLGCAMDSVRAFDCAFARCDCIAGVATAVAGLARVACNPALAQCHAALDQSTPPSTLVHFRAAMFVFTPLVIAAFVLVRAVWRTGRRRVAMWGLAAALLDVVETYLVLNDLTPVTGLLQRTLLLGLYGLPITVPLVLTRGRPR